jgi:putative ABC transport system permease protein
MRLIDLLQLVGDNISRRKGRVALTAIGVVIGTAAVVVLVSLGIGLQRNATQQLGGIADLTLINVSPTYGEAFFGGGGGGGGGGIAVEGPGVQTVEQQLITDQSLLDFAGLEGVVGVYPRDYLQGGAVIKLGRLENYPNILGVTEAELTELDLPLAQGSTELARGTTVVGSYVPMNFYNPFQRPGEAPPSPPELFDETLNMVLSRWSSEGVETRRTVPLRVVGTLQETRGESDYSMYVRLPDLEAYNQWLTGRRVNRTATRRRWSRRAIRAWCSTLPTRSRPWATRPIRRCRLCRASIRSSPSCRWYSAASAPSPCWWRRSASPTR